MTMQESNRAQRLIRFVIGIGAVSFFADFTYEGGRSIIGPFLAVLGAGPVLAGVVAGLGEVLGYGIRLLSGRYADQSRQYWPVMGLGYVLNLLAVPTLALASSLAPAVTLIFVERLGKGLRNPPRDTLLSQAGRELGHGRVFGIHEFLDQTGAFVGPLVVAVAVAFGGYRLGFGLLIVPALLALFMLARAHRLTPTPSPDALVAPDHPLPSAYFRYIAFSALTVMGFSHFILVSYHLEMTHRLSAAGIPLLFALAMGSDALAAIGTGHFFDRIGFRILYGLPLLILSSTPLLFLAHSPWLIAVGAGLWGAAMGIQESVMRAGVARLSPETRRGSAYGLFDTVFGLAWMLGSILMGWLYRHSAQDLVLFAFALQISSFPLLLWTVASLRSRT